VVGGLLLAPTPAPAQVQVKVGFVKLRTLFDNYYKRKQADLLIKQQAGDLEKELEEKLAKRKVAEEAYTTANASAGDLAVSKEERDRRKADAEIKMTELRKIEQDITVFRQQADAILRERTLRMRTRVLEDIQAEIDAKAKAEGYQLIVNVEAEDPNQTRIFLYHDGSNDITDVILGKLNAGAPANLNVEADAAESKIE
jgi:Skp family chaperone for outer membrane proteins